MALLKTPLYALEHPAVPGRYYRMGGHRPRLTAPERASLAPHTQKGLDWIRDRSAALAAAGLENELVRLDA